MGTKMHRGSKRAALIGAAALPAIAGLTATLMSSSAANAAITFSITNQGVTHDNFGDTATGWSSYVLTLIADPGDKITAVDFGQTAASTNGIFGAVLQNWVPAVGKNPATATPVEPDKNGDGYGIDSHFLTPSTSRADVTSPFEDNNQINPGGGVPASTSTQAFGTGTAMHGVYGITGANQLNSTPTAYIVLKDGTSATFQDTEKLNEIKG